MCKKKKKSVTENRIMATSPSAIRAEIDFQYVDNNDSNIIMSFSRCFDLYVAVHAITRSEPTQRSWTISILYNSCMLC